MTDKYVIITGAYGGLGKALSYKYAQEGYALILLGRKQRELDILSQELSEITETKSIVCDVSNWESCKAVYQRVSNWNIKPKILINNAGITYIHKLDKEYDIERYQNLINTNLNGSVYLTQLFIEDLVQNLGSVIVISSVIGYAPVIGRTAYAASKFGLEGFYSVLAAEQDKQLHIMLAYPTFIETAIRKDVKGDKTVNEILTADVVADKVYEGYKAKKQRIYIGKTAKLSYYLYKFAPKLYVRLMRKKINQQT